MIDSDLAITLYLVFLVLNIAGIFLARIESGAIINFTLGIMAISFGVYILSNPDVFYVIWSQPIYFVNGTLLYAGGWETYTQTFLWHPMSELLLVLAGVINILVGVTTLRS